MSERERGIDESEEIDAAPSGDTPEITDEILDRARAVKRDRKALPTRRLLPRIPAFF